METLCWPLPSWKALLCLGLLMVHTVLHAAPPASPTAQPPIEELGDGRYRIGSIQIDKTRGEFTIPGEVIELKDEFTPIEFIAVTRGGYKRYEALFELDTSAVEFNLACILIGLDAEHATQAKRHFDPEPLKGDMVSVQVSWQDKDGTRQLPVGDVLRLGEQEEAADEWVYTGSFFTEQGAYVADLVGTLVGFSHDPESVIQHRYGLGLGNYGSVRYNPAVLPKAGTAIRLHIARIASH